MRYSRSITIPKIKRHRSQLWFKDVEYDDQAYCIWVTADTYPELFQYHLPGIHRSTPKDWIPSHSGKSKYLWFPPDVLDADDRKRICTWKERFGQYILLSEGRPLAGQFAGELDFCMALDFNFADPDEGVRTALGEAEYQIKYGGQATDKQIELFCEELFEGFEWLPIPHALKRNLVVSAMPVSPSKEDDLSRTCAEALAEKKNVLCLKPVLSRAKPQMKELTLAQKVATWSAIYSGHGNVRVAQSVSDATIVVVDDLYQSGVTMWSYAKYLKQLGAKAVVGLACVKSMRDSDNK